MTREEAGKRLRMLRGPRGLREIERTAGIRHGILGDLERGAHRRLPRYAVKLASVLGGEVLALVIETEGQMIPPFVGDKPTAAVLRRYLLVVAQRPEAFEGWTLGPLLLLRPRVGQPIAVAVTD